jgi:hypothetical protein
MSLPEIKLVVLIVVSVVAGGFLLDQIRIAQLKSALATIFSDSKPKSRQQLESEGRAKLDDAQTQERVRIDNAAWLREEHARNNAVLSGSWNHPASKTKQEAIDSEKYWIDKAVASARANSASYSNNPKSAAARSYISALDAYNRANGHTINHGLQEPTEIGRPYYNLAVKALIGQIGNATDFSIVEAYFCRANVNGDYANVSHVWGTLKFVDSSGLRKSAKWSVVINYKLPLRGSAAPRPSDEEALVGPWDTAVWFWDLESSRR